jgi:hypothetical protein
MDTPANLHSLPVSQPEPPTCESPNCAVSPGSAEQRPVSLEAAILWGEGDESLPVSLGIAAAMEPTEDEGSTAARLLAAEVRRLREALYAVTTQLEHVERLRRMDCGPIPATLSPEVIAAAKLLLPNT